MHSHILSSFGACLASQLFSPWLKLSSRILQFQRKKKSSRKSAKIHRNIVINCRQTSSDNACYISSSVAIYEIMDFLLCAVVNEPSSVCEFSQTDKCNGFSAASYSLGYHTKNCNKILSRLTVTDSIVCTIKKILFTCCHRLTLSSSLSLPLLLLLLFTNALLSLFVCGEKRLLG